MYICIIKSQMEIQHLNQTALSLAHEADRFASFCNTEQWHFLPMFPSFLYSDGVKQLTEECQSYWLLIEIFARCNKQVSFQSWKLRRNGSGNTFILSGDDRNGKVFSSTVIPFSDFPFDGVDLSFITGIDPDNNPVLCLTLPNEY